MLKSFKYRISPTEAQKVLIHKHIGCSRMVFNLALETKNMAYLGNKVNLSVFDLIKQLPDLKKEFEWLKEVNSQSLQQSIQNMDIAFKKFFKGAGFPKFKKKSNRGSFCVPQNVKIEGGRLVIPKFKGGIKINLYRQTKGVLKRATISVTPTGKYFASILCDTLEQKPTKVKIKESSTIGVDLGIKDFAITSEGEVFENPKYLKSSLARLQYAQRRLSKYKGKRSRLKVAKLHEKVANKRKDFLHKLSSELVKNHDTIALETLAVKNMIKNHKLAQAISDASWSTFVTILEYKSDWYGKNILRIGQFAPSSKSCSCCGTINKELQLKDREWTCSGCSTVLHRDVNAAINIKSFALKNILSGTDRKNQGELPTLVGVSTLEAHPIASGVGE